jgi:hypothetical protein
VTIGEFLLSPRRAIRSFGLVSSLALAGVAQAGSQDILIFDGGNTGDPIPSDESNLTAQFLANGGRSTILSSLPANLSNYSQVWDLNVFGGAMTAGTQAQLSSYLRRGGGAFVMGENVQNFSTVDLSILQLVNSLGGGRLSLAALPFASNTETVNAPLTGPTTVPGNQIIFDAAGAVANAGRGICLAAAIPSLNGGASGCSAMLFKPGSLSNAQKGTLVVVFDVNFLDPNDSDHNAATSAFVSNLVRLVTFEVVSGGATSTSAAQQSAATTEPKLQRAVTSQIVDQISGRIADTVVSAAAGVTVPGVAAGDADEPPIGVWIDSSTGYIANSATGQAFGGTLQTGLVGVDALLDKQWLVGLAIGGEGDSLHIRDTMGLRDGTGFSLTPYAAYIVNDWLSADLQLSYGNSSNFNEIGQGTPAQADGNFSAERYFVSGHLNAVTHDDGFTFRGSFGYLYAYSHLDQYTDSLGNLVVLPGSHLSEFKLGGEVSYTFENKIEPFLSTTVEYQPTVSSTSTPVLGQTISDTHTGVLLNFGLRNHAEDSLSFGIQGSVEFRKSSETNENFGLFARWDF